MKIVNIEKLDGHNTIVLTGRNEYVVAIAKYLQAKLYHYPNVEDHYTDYPKIIKELNSSLMNETGIIIITTQSKEFLDYLLESELDFVQATVRHYEHDDDDKYRIRVLPKEEALACRDAFNMELRL